MLLAGVAVAVYFAFIKKQDNYTNPNAAFETQPTTPAKKKPKPPKPETFKWPIYGYTRDRTRFLDANIHPPFRAVWFSILIPRRMSISMSLSTLRRKCVTAFPTSGWCHFARRRAAKAYTS